MFVKCQIDMKTISITSLCTTIIIHTQQQQNGNHNDRNIYNLRQIKGISYFKKTTMPLDVHKKWGKKTPQSHMCFLVDGFNPFEEYQSKWESSPNRAANKKYLKPPPSFYVFWKIHLQTSTRPSHQRPEHHAAHERPREWRACLSFPSHLGREVSPVKWHPFSLDLATNI